MSIIYEMFADLPRQGPGDDASTRRAFQMLTGLPAQPEILDVGCGNGAQTLALARLCQGRITAVDIYESFLDPSDRADVGSRLRVISDLLVSRRHRSCRARRRSVLANRSSQ